jgi:hypothetical protein
MADYTMKFQPGTSRYRPWRNEATGKEFGGELRLQNANPGTLVEAVIPIGSVPLDSKAEVAAPMTSNLLI